MDTRDGKDVRTKGYRGLHPVPGKAYLEIRGRLQNRSALRRLFCGGPILQLCGDEYQSVFPPDVHAVFDHGKRDVSSFP
jgi:hypothetical protein